MNIDQLTRFIGPLKRRIQMMVGRGVVKASVDTKGLQQLQCSVLADETLDNVERVQQYGFTSNPLPGAEFVMVQFGGNRDQSVVIAVDDKRYRMKSLQPGEVALYTDEGDSIVFKRGNKIEITTKELTVNAEDKVIVNTKEAEVNATTSATVTTATAEITASAEATVTSPQITLVAVTKVTATTPLMEVSGLITCAGLAAGVGAVPVAGKAIVQGDIEATGNMEAAGEVQDANGTMTEMRGIYNAHVHPENNGGGGNPNTAAPTVPMT